MVQRDESSVVGGPGGMWRVKGLQLSGAVGRKSVGAVAASVAQLFTYCSHKGKTLNCVGTSFEIYFLKLFDLLEIIQRKKLKKTLFKIKIIIYKTIK